MSWIILFSGALNLFLGLTIWLRDLKNRLNFGFGIFSLSTVVLILLDFWFRLDPTVFVLQSSYAFATFIPSTAIIWILELCRIDLGRNESWVRRLLFVPGIILFIASYIDGLLVESVESLTVLGFKGQLGPLFTAYSFYFAAYIGSFVFLLVRAHNRSVDRVYRLQTLYVLMGIILYSFSALIFSLILPKYFGVFDFTLLDAPSLIFFVGFTAYAIMRLHLFNIKVLSTEMLVFTLSTIMLIRTFLSGTTQDQLINGGVFAGVLVVGTFLIRSVIKEVTQREKIERLAKDLESANEKLKELDQLKSEFVSLASHQLRGPLTAIKGYTSEIIEGDFGELPKHLEEPVHTIFQSCQSLVVIVEDFLNVSRIDQGRMKYEMTEFDLGELVREVMTENAPTFERKHLRSITDADNGVKVLADRGKVKQIIGNLVDNSLKYTKEGEISVGVKRVGEKVVFSIRDTGVGIRKETMPKLFQKFSRAEDASKANILGTGLGLYVASQMIKAHNGRIWAESAGEGKGSAFFVELKAL